MRYLFFILLIFFISCKTTNPLSKSGDSPKSGDTTNVDTISKSDSSILSSSPDEYNTESNELGDVAPVMEKQSIKNKSLSPKRISQSQFKDKKKTELKKKSKDIGNLVYQIPDTMVLNRTYIIKIRIDRDTLDKSIFDNIKVSVDTQIKTSSTMQVSIVDPSPSFDKSFDIVKNNTDIQILDTTGITEWIYNITPIKSGKLKLNIVVSIIVGPNQKQIVYTDTILVKSAPLTVVKSFWSKNWQWIISTFILPFIIWFYKRKKEKDKPKN